MKPDCYQCIHRSRAIGSAHSSCNHPVTQTDLENPFNSILAVFASVGRVEPLISESAKELKIEVNQQGFQSGWANWPWDYDPVWINNCEGFEAVKLPFAQHDKNIEEI